MAPTTGFARAKRRRTSNPSSRRSQSRRRSDRPCGHLTRLPVVWNVDRELGHERSVPLLAAATQGYASVAHFHAPPMKAPIFEFVVSMTTGMVPVMLAGVPLAPPATARRH